MEDVFKDKGVEQDTNRDRGCVAIVQVLITGSTILTISSRATYQQSYQTVTAVAQREYLGFQRRPVVSLYQWDRPRSQDST